MTWCCMLLMAERLSKYIFSTSIFSQLWKPLYLFLLSFNVHHQLSLIPYFFQLLFEFLFHFFFQSFFYSFNNFFLSFFIYFLSSFFFQALPFFHLPQHFFTFCQPIKYPLQISHSFIKISKNESLKKGSIKGIILHFWKKKKSSILGFFSNIGNC